LYVNIGQSHSKQGDYASAKAQFEIAEKLGEEHVASGNAKDGKSMVACSKRAHAFALRRTGKIDEAKSLLREVLQNQIMDNLEAEKQKLEEAKAAAVAEAEKNKEKEDAS